MKDAVTADAASAAAVVAVAVNVADARAAAKVHVKFNVRARVMANAKARETANAKARATAPATLAATAATRVALKVIALPLSAMSRAVAATPNARPRHARKPAASIRRASSTPSRIPTRRWAQTANAAAAVVVVVAATVARAVTPKTAPPQPQHLPTPMAKPWHLRLPLRAMP